MPDPIRPPTCSPASVFSACVGIAVDVICFFIALLSSCEISTPSLPAQGKQRRSSIFDIPRDIPRLTAMVAPLYVSATPTIRRHSVGLMSDRITISVVVPVFNEERNIAPFLARIEPVLEKIGPYEIIFSLDPCRDRTEAVIAAEAERNPSVGLLRFSRRFGQPAATLAGVFNARGEWVVVIDVDLQDPPELIEKLYARAQEGFDVVMARRTTREGETFVKKLISSVGYKVINQVSDISIPRNTGDFRIMSRRIVEELRGLSESHGFLRGLVSLVGIPTDVDRLRTRRPVGRPRQLQPLPRVAQDRLQRPVRILDVSAPIHDVGGLRRRPAERSRHHRRLRA